MRSTAVPLFALILLAAPAASQNAPPPPTVTETPRPAAVKPTEVRGPLPHPARADVIPHGRRRTLPGRGPRGTP